MIGFYCENHNFRYELEHTARMFLPGQSLFIAGEEPPPEEAAICTRVRPHGEGCRLSVHVRLKKPVFSKEEHLELAGGAPPNEVEVELARLLFRLLKEATGETPPWGVLTGVRPVRLFQRHLEEGLGEKEACALFCEKYYVNPAKITLLVETARAQQHMLKGMHPRGFSLYIGIPFCPTRCLYCSFVSHSVERFGKLVPSYMEALCGELEATGAMARRLGLSLETVYIGGGTPTTLTPGQLETLLAAVEAYFDLGALKEYTVEAGRPDTVSIEKLAVLRKFGVGRVSINPQTMDDTILSAIGRSHSAEDVRSAMEQVAHVGGFSVNMDLIAGLPGETGQEFEYSLGEVLRMRPDNITVHTLTVKRSSRLRGQQDAYAATQAPLGALLASAHLRLGEAGMRPYYLYRQKGTVQNLENTGYSLLGGESLYNIYSMEEVQTILAVGAGGVTKLCGGGRIQRIFNYKYPHEYIKGLDRLIARKSAVEEFYANYFGKEIHPG